MFVPTVNVQTMIMYYKAIFEIIKTGHWITDSITKELKVFAISEPQFNVLRILQGAKSDPISVNTILDGMFQRSSNITRIVDKLEAKALVKRTISRNDRRKMDIIITPEGIELLQELNKKVKHFHLPMTSKLSTEELKTLAFLIQKLRKKNSIN